MFLSKKILYVILIVFVLLITISYGFWIKNKTGRHSSAFVFDGNDLSTELNYIRENLQSASLNDLGNYFQTLANKKGAKYAFEVLKVAELPKNVDLHLAAHIVGDLLYKQEGVEGIKLCTHDFRNACSHSIVIGALLEEGESALPKISEACRQAPGGKGAYTMCFHGLGHGVLAYVGYDLEKAIDTCKKTGTPEYGYREYVECVGGGIMEMMAGVHDRKAWEIQKGKYFKEDDPLYPCNSDLMPSETKTICYSYLTPHLFEAAGADLAQPLPEHFEKAFRFCDGIEDSLHRDVCYGSLGKEFVVLVQERDIRKIEDMDDEKLKKLYEWCLLGGNDNAKLACTLHVINSLFWGGENNRSVSIRFCSLIENGDYQTACFTFLTKSIEFYIDDYSYRKEFCNELPTLHRNECKKILVT